jgi:hypothetical protein
MGGIRTIVSTTSIPNHSLHSKAGSATDLPIGGQLLDADKGSHFNAD